MHGALRVASSFSPRCSLSSIQGQLVLRVVLTSASRWKHTHSAQRVETHGCMQACSAAILTRLHGLRWLPWLPQQGEL
jgi:hypothetical protein